MKQWKRLAALSSAIVMAAATLTYFPSDTLQNIRLEISASAETTTEPQVWIEDNLTWTLDADGTLTISGTGAMKDYNAADNLSPAHMNSDVKKVVIEDGVTSIGELAFYKCSSLTNITIPDSVTCIAYAAFHGCSSLSSITIPNSVTSIGIYAFVVCSSLTSITIPDGVTSIGYGAFSDCSSLKTISLSCKSSLKKSDFGEQADLVSYTNQHLLTKTAAKSATCTESGNKAYWTCEHCGKYFLSDDTNPETAKAVELSETVIPALNHKNAIIQNASEPTETDPGYSGDRYCPDCDTVFEKGYTYWNEDNLTWKLYEDGTLTISGTGAMKDYDYYNNPSPASQKKDSVKKVVIEDGVTSIRNSAFYDCNSLTSITIPNSVTSIGDSAFSNCYYLTNITIPNSVTSIENYAFRSCSSLTSITIPDSVTSIGKLAFYSCDSLTSITISNSVTSIEERAFAYCSRLTSITIPDSVTSIGEAAFAGCSSLTSITIPDSVTSIGEYAFQSCSRLTSITIPDSVTSIGAYAFSDCWDLTSITIPDSVTTIGESAFNACSSLTTISLSCKSSLKRSDFGKQADLVSYTSHTLNKTEAKAATCTENGNKEYWTCEHCKKYFLSDDANPETAKAVEQSECMIPAIQHKNAITRGASEPTETAPGYSGDRYCPDCDKVVEKGYTYWIEDNLTWKLYEDGTLNISGKGAMKDYSYDSNQSPVYNNSNVKKVVIEDGVTSIGTYAFYDCSSLTSITIPNSVTSIGDSAFSNCYYLTNITIPNSVTSIENYAFRSCSSLTSITIPDGVTGIGEAAFRNCSSLTSITIPDSVTSIGESAFESCWNLTSITIPDSVTSIGNYAFYNCNSLTSVTIPDSVTSIGKSVFYNCSGLTSITIPDSVTSIGNYTFNGCSSLTSITIPDGVTSIGYDVFKNCSNLTTISLSCKSSLKRSDFGEQANLVSYTSHTLKKTEAKAATCTEDGNKEYWTCEHCGKYFLSDDTNPETAKAVEQSETVIPVSHKLTKVEAKAATCTENGNKEYWTCEHCGKYFLSDDTNPETAKAVEQSETVIPALKHKNAIIQNAAEPTETAPGYSGDRYCPDCDKVLEKGYTYWIEDNLIWKLYEDGKLTISGTGTMKDYDSDSNPSPIYNNSDVKEVVIEDGVTSIGNKAFDSCSSLTSITIPNSVTSIKAATFYGCTSLTSITIPDGVTSIGYATFTGCSSLTSITIPDSVTSIGYATFAGCSSLTSITIPDSVTSIGESAFSNCSSLQTISLSCKSTLKRSDFGDQANLVSYASHTLKKIEAKAATCSEDGNKEYWTCEHCGKYFLSDDSNPETAKAVELLETVIPALVQVATMTTPIKCVYGQDMSKIDLRDYVKNTDVVGEVMVKVATGSTLPDGMKLDGSKLSGKPAKAYEDGKEVTFTFTAENGNTANLTLLFLVAKADPTVEVAVSGDSHTEGDLVSELKLILSENSTKGVVELVSEIKALVAGKNTLTWKFTPEDENNYHTVTGTVVVNAQTTTTTTTTTKATTTTTKATTTTKPNKTTTTKVTTTTKPSKTTTTKVTTTTKPSKMTTTKATTTTKPSKTTTTKVTTTTKPSKTTTTKATTTTKPSKTTTTKATTTTKPSKTTTTKVTTTTKPNKTTTTKVTTTTKPSKTTTTKATTTNTAIPSYGDVNLDGKVDIVDAIFLNKYLATLIQFSDAQMANADCCQDGVLNDQDTTALMQFIILLIDDLPAQPTEK